MELFLKLIENFRTLEGGGEGAIKTLLIFTIFGKNLANFIEVLK